MDTREDGHQGGWTPGWMDTRVDGHQGVHKGSLRGGAPQEPQERGCGGEGEALSPTSQEGVCVGGRAKPSPPHNKEDRTYIFPIYSLYIPYIFLIYSLYIPYIYI